jgi:hypothetical protein
MRRSIPPRRRVVLLEAVMTRLDKPLRRELEVKGVIYTLTLDPSGLKLTEKGHRNGTTMAWLDLINGDAALAAALRGSVRSSEQA